jgi:hypothetical protein
MEGVPLDLDLGTIPYGAGATAGGGRRAFLIKRAEASEVEI